jgi:hypothetical protein
MCARLLLVALLTAGISASATDIAVRLINVDNGSGLRGCWITLDPGDPSDHSRRAVPFLNAKTGAGGIAHFQLPEPAPSQVFLGPVSYCAIACDRVHPISVDNIMRTGVTIGYAGKYEGGAPFCRPNLTKLQGIAAKPGEVLIFARKRTLWEKLNP